MMMTKILIEEKNCGVWTLYFYKCKKIFKLKRLKIKKKKNGTKVPSRLRRDSGFNQKRTK